MAPCRGLVAQSLLSPVSDAVIHPFGKSTRSSSQEALGALAGSDQRIDKQDRLTMLYQQTTQPGSRSSTLRESVRWVWGKISMTRASSKPRSCKSVRKLTVGALSAIVCASSLTAQASLIVNGSFENRTTPPPPTSTPPNTFTQGNPDNWIAETGNGFTDAYLVHESHPTVPGNAAIDGDIIVGGNGNIFLTQNFTVTSVGALRATWAGNNETFTDGRGDINIFYRTAVQIAETDGTFIDWSGLRSTYNETAIAWSNESWTSTEIFTPGTYQVQFIVGGLSSADNLIITQVPEPSVLFLIMSGLMGLRFRHRARS